MIYLQQYRITNTPTICPTEPQELNVDRPARDR